MKVVNLNIRNIKICKSSFVSKNSIQFKGQDSGCDFFAKKSIPDNNSGQIANSEPVDQEYKPDLEDFLFAVSIGETALLNEIDNLDRVCAEYREKISMASMLKEKFTLDSCAINRLSVIACINKDKELFKTEIRKILQEKFPESLANNELLDFCTIIVERSLRCTSAPEKVNDSIAQEIDNYISVLQEQKTAYDIRYTRATRQLRQQIIRFNRFHNLDPAATYQDFERKIQEGLKDGSLLDLNNEEYSYISQDAKELLYKVMQTVQLKKSFFPLNNDYNAGILTMLGDSKVYSLDEIKIKYAIPNPDEIFSDCNVCRLYNGTSLATFPLDSVAIQILNDIAGAKVATVEGISKEKSSRINQKNTPFAYKKYTDSEEPNVLDFMFVDLEDEYNLRLIKDYKYRQMAAGLNFKRNKLGYIDLNDKENKSLLYSTQPIFPIQSKYFLGSLGGAKSNVVDIPVDYLASLGFSTVEKLEELIDKGELDGWQDENGNSFVKIDTKNRLGKNKNLDILYSQRRMNPRIKTFDQVKKALHISAERLERAIFYGDVEIIGEYINMTDKEIRYINITTPKNLEFIRRIGFENELKNQLNAQQQKETREANRLKKIAKQDLKQRVAGVRMALVWEFMPNTKAIASTLASNDGYVSRLLAKEDDSTKKLTSKEEVVLAKYRREFWLQAGTQELQMAYKKANAIMKLFNEQGIGAIDEQYLPIFERYGFILA